MLPSAQLPAIVKAAGTTIDPTTGNLFITAFDCTGQRAAGVTYAISKNKNTVVPLYVKKRRCIRSTHANRRERNRRVC